MRLRHGRAGGGFPLHSVSPDSDGAPVTTAKQPIADPHDVPVTYVTGFVGNIFNGQTIAVNFVTDRLGIFPDGSSESELVIVARLRFDVHVATRLRDQLNLYIAGISAPRLPDEQAN
jgi:hypothetical protein